MPNDNDNTNTPAKPRLIAVFFSRHQEGRDTIADAIPWALNDFFDMPGPFALVGPSENAAWTRVWMDHRSVRVHGGCFSGSLEETEQYGLSTNDDDDNPAAESRQEDIIALIREAAKWVQEVSKKAG